MSWRDEVLTQCSGSQHPSSLPVKGAGHARVSAPSASWCHALVATGVVRHHNPIDYVILKRRQNYNKLDGPTKEEVSGYLRPDQILACLMTFQ